MTKIVNLDELVAVSRAVTFQKKKYPIEDLSVLDYVSAQNAATACQAAMTAGDMPGVVEQAGVVVKLAVPGFPIEQIAKMNHRQIIALIALIFDQYPSVEEEVPQKAEDSSGKRITALDQREIETVDFPYILAETMRFYGWTWEALMRTPIFGFWTCYRQMHRLQAQEKLDQFQVLALQNTEDRAMRKGYVDDLRNVIGTVVKHKDKPASEGVNRLKGLTASK